MKSDIGLVEVNCNVIRLDIQMLHLSKYNSLNLSSKLTWHYYDLIFLLFILLVRCSAGPCWFQTCAHHVRPGARFGCTLDSQPKSKISICGNECILVYVGLIKTDQCHHLHHRQTEQQPANPPVGIILLQSGKTVLSAAKPQPDNQPTQLGLSSEGESECWRMWTELDRKQSFAGDGEGEREVFLLHCSILRWVCFTMEEGWRA